MRRPSKRQKHKPATINWESEKYAKAYEDPVSRYDNGDLVAPCVNLVIRCNDNVYEGHPVAFVEHGNYTECRTIDGETQGIYVGTQRFKAPKMPLVGHGWSARRVTDLHEMHNIFVSYSNAS